MQNFRKMEMQIPYENSEISIHNISKNYKIYDKKSVINFLKENNLLINYIDKITQLINCYFPNYEKSISYNEDPEFEDLNNLSIYIYSKEKHLNQDLEKLDNLENEIISLKNFSTRTKGLVSVDLWS